MNSTLNLLSIHALKTYFPIKSGLFRKKRFLRANDGVSLEIKQGETLALVGESGSGKSTLGKSVLQLVDPTDGEVIYYGADENGVDLTKLKREDMRKLRKDLQMIFQDPYSSLNPRMTVGQLVGEGAVTHGFFKRGSGELSDYVAGVLQDCGLSADALQRYPHQFSGGQRQRVCIARALAVKPKFVVCDECVSALDSSVQSQILNLLSDLKERENLTYLFISHDLSVVRHIADRVAVMYLGKIVELGTAKEIFSSPRHPYTIALISAAPSVDKRKNEERILLNSHLPSAVSPPQGCPFHPRCFMAKEECRRISAPFVEVENGHFAACHFAGKPTQDKKRIAKRNTGTGEKI